MKTLALGICAGAVLCFNLYPQEVPRFTGNVGGGFTQAVGNTGRHLDTGWNIDVGGGVNFNAYVGALVQFNYNMMDVNNATLNALGFPDGDVQMWSVTLDPIVHVAPRGPVDIYLIGGGGLYHRRQEFTAPTTAIFTGLDPFFGFYNFPVPATRVLTSYSVNKPGVNGGMGIAFGTRWHAKVYAEARYHRMFLGNDYHTDIVPVTFGVRW